MFTLLGVAADCYLSWKVPRKRCIPCSARRIWVLKKLKWVSDDTWWKLKRYARIASILGGFIRPCDLRKVTWQPSLHLLYGLCCLCQHGTTVEVMGMPMDLELLIAYPGLRDLFQLLPSPGEILGLLKEGIWVFHIEFEANVSAALCIRCLIPKRMKLIERASYYPEILDFELCVGSQWDFRLSLWQKRFWMFSKQKEE